MKSYQVFFILCALLVIASCKKEASKDTDFELAELFSLMQGSFNSQAQAVTDSSYYNISLHMYPIWIDQGRFLYVEQALNSRQNKPYRQRIYELTRINDSLFSSAIYTLPVDSIWIGKWNNPAAFDSISKSDLLLRTGCEVLLTKVGEHHFKGSTNEKTCESSLRGASYATSEVEILKDKILSWDRGFDSIGQQVWGAEKGGYHFDKIKTN